MSPQTENMIFFKHAREKQLRVSSAKEDRSGGDGREGHVEKG